MGLQWEGDQPEFTPWQVGRLRARLVAYYFLQQKKQQIAYDPKARNIGSNTINPRPESEVEFDRYYSSFYFSWKDLAYEIVKDMPEFFELDDGHEELKKKDKNKDEEEDEPDWTIEEKEKSKDDLDWPIRGDNLNKWFRGEPRSYNGRAYRTFYTPVGKPKGVALPAIYQFLKTKGHVTDADFIELIDWPEPDHIDIGDLLEKISPQKLSLFSRDYRNASIEENIERFISIYSPRSDKLLKLRMCKNLTMSKGLNLRGNCTWLWGWLTFDDEGTGFIHMEEASGSFPIKEKYVLKDYTIGNEPVIEKEAITELILSPIYEEGENSTEQESLVFSIYCEQKLTKILQNSNIGSDTQSSNKFLLVSPEAQKELETLDLTAAEGKKLITRAKLSNGDSGKYVMSSSKKYSPVTEKLIKEAREEFNTEWPPEVFEEISTMTDPDMMAKRLHYSILYFKPPEVIPELIAQGVDVNQKYPEIGMTALHFAAGFNDRLSIKELIKSDKLDYLVQNAWGELPSTIAFERSINPAIGRFLIKKEMQQAEAEGIDYEALLKAKSSEPEKFTL